MRNGLVNESNERLYLAGIYWAFTVLTTVGFGDIHARTEGEMVICILWMLFGIGFYSFAIGSLTSVLFSLDAKSSMLN